MLVAVEAVTVSETSDAVTFQNNLLSFRVVKKNGYIQNLTYDGVSLLGGVSGNAGQLYSDFPSNVFSLSVSSLYEVVNGTNWAGIILTDNDTTGGLVQRSWFLRDNEAGLHSFVRLGYHNSSDSIGRGELGEVRTMFRPNSAIWTTLVTNTEQWAPIPSAEAIAKEVQVQDATWYLGNTPDDLYVQLESDYWTKYTFADNQTNKAHGLVGSKPDGTPLAAWWVVNQVDTYFGGPTHVDLMVDGIIYNKYSTNHGGATSPNITNGFDRTTRLDLLSEAESRADITWSADFYDEIAPHVPGYVTSARRGKFQARVVLPKGATKAVAVLSANGVHFQDSAAVPGAYQYWANIDNGLVSLDRVKEGSYRLTIFANGIFGDYTQDNIEIRAGRTTSLNSVVWNAETHADDITGTELWRIGIPDKTSGEFRNGWERDPDHPNHPSKYRIYWGAWDFPSQFPGGANFTVGKSNEALDWNYVHWSQFGPTYTRNGTVTDINQWQIHFELSKAPSRNSVATFTIQLAAAKTTSGNTDDPKGAYPNFNLTTIVNDRNSTLNWEIQWFESSSCAERSAISCHLLSRKFEFPGQWLSKGHNKFVYVQYDALRLELRD
ncbi:galactose mutarotase-like protein [Panus rudis PR-1116 ss-1]|nr:galactose mutarotase-like protein [Panus rudis PR-1116 ss-1]